MILHPTDTTFQSEVLESQEPVMVEFWAPWCGPCKQMAPILEELAQEYENRGVKIAKVDVDENPATAGQFGVMSIPTFILLKSGKEIERFVGARSRGELSQKLNQLVS